MPTRYYLDACIWLDYMESRSDHLRPLSEFAFQLIRKIIEEESCIVFSDLLEEELLRKTTAARLDSLKQQFNPQDILFIKLGRHQISEARAISAERAIPFGDAVHAIASRDCAAIMVTRDKHFQELQDIARPFRPEELI